MSRIHRSKGFTLVQALLAVAILSAISSVAFPVVAKAARQDGTIDDSAQNERQIALAGIMYSGDYDDEIAVLVSGQYRNLQDVPDGQLTRSGDERANGWPLMLLPYIKSELMFVDPTRVDGLNIWSGPARGMGQEGYDAGKNTYRNQSRFPMYAVNYMFCSPGILPKDKIGQPNAMDFMTGQAHSFIEADDPSGTVYYVPSRNYGASAQGFFVANAPGMWRAMKTDSQYVVFWGGQPCTGDWCYDMDSKKDGAQSQTNSVWFNRDHNTPVTFLDGHVRILSDVRVADGTDYQTATANDGPRPNSKGGGAVIVDKTHYLWNLTNNYYGL